MSFTLELQRAWERASILSGPEDLLPANAFRLLVNARLDRTKGIPVSRPGCVQLTTAALASGVVLAHSKLYGVSADYSYAQVGTALVRLDNAWTDASKVTLASGLAPTVLSDTNFLDGFTIPHKFLVGPVIKKDNGTTFSNIGIVGPAAAPASAILGTRNRLVLHAMDSTATWSTTNLTGFTTDTSVKQEGSASLTFAIAENTLGTLQRTPLTGALALYTGTHTGVDTQTSLTDTTKDFTASPVRLGATVRNTTRGFTGIVTRITATQLFFDAGLAGNVFNNGDAYDIYWHLDSFQLVPGASTGTDNSGINTKSFSMTDTTKDFVREGVTPGMVLRNTTSGAKGFITSLGTTTNPNDTLRVTGGMSGGATTVFNTGDGYTVFNDLVKADDWLHLFVRVDFPERIQYLQLDVDVDPSLSGSYANNYYTLRISPTRLNQGSGEWTELFLRKSEFQRSGTNAAGWEFVLGWRLRVQTTSTPGGVTVWVDDFSLLGGIGIEGALTYTGIYVNETTGCLSSPPKDVNEVVAFTTSVTAARHPIVLDLTNISSGSTPAPDTQVTHIWLYRRGGGLVAATNPTTGLPAPGVFVAAVLKTATSFTDQRANVQLSSAKILETDNDPLPTDATVIFGPGGVQRLFYIHQRNKVGYTKAWERGTSRAENCPKTFEFQIGDGSQEALNGIAQDQNIFIYSESQDWQILGQGPDAFLPVPVPLTRGIASRFGLTSGDGQIFKLQVDGVYTQTGLNSHKLTSDIDPFFLGQTVHGQLPLASSGTPGSAAHKAALAQCRLAWYPHPQDPQVVLLYPDSGSTPNKILILKKNLRTGHYTDCFFDSLSGFAARSVLSDPQSLLLTYGGDNGRIYQGEVDTATSDDGAAIAGRVRTGAAHQGVPRVVKTYSDVVVQANTGGALMAVTASFNTSGSTVAAGTVIGTTDASEAQLILAQASPPSALLRHNIALDLTWAATTKVAISQLGWHVQTEVEEVTFLDTGTMVFASPHLLWHLLHDVDAPSPVTGLVYLDGSVQPSLTIPPTVGRQRVDTQVSLPSALVRGRTFRLTLASPTAFLPYAVGGDFESEPLAMTAWDSRELTFMFLNAVKWIAFDVAALANLQVLLYLDGVLRDSRPLFATVGRQRVDHLLPAALAGKTLRITCTSPQPFQRWSVAAFTKVWGSATGYAPQSLEATEQQMMHRALYPTG